MSQGQWLGGGGPPVPGPKLEKSFIQSAYNWQLWGGRHKTVRVSIRPQNVWHQPWWKDTNPVLKNKQTKPPPGLILVQCIHLETNKIVKTSLGHSSTGGWFLDFQYLATRIILAITKSNVNNTTLFLRITPCINPNRNKSGDKDISFWIITNTILLTFLKDFSLLTGPEHMEKGALRLLTNLALINHSAT